MSPRAAAFVVAACSGTTVTMACRAAPPIVTLRPDDATLRPLEWMAGSWVGAVAGHRVEEHWLMPSGGTMAGVHRIVGARGTVALVFLSLSIENDLVVLAAEPSEGARVRLQLVAVGPGKASFAADDGAMQVAYERHGPRLIIAMQRTGEAPEQFVLQRARLGAPEEEGRD